jgi:hypothetical protein
VAVARDLAHTARALARLSPHLPELLREASSKARTAGGVPIRVRLRWGPAALWVALGAALALAGAFMLGAL